MDALQIGALIVVIVCVGAWLVARFLTRRRTSEPRLVAPIDVGDQRAVAELAGQDRLSEAAALLRARYGLSLQDAVSTARSLVAGETPPSTWVMAIEALDPEVHEQVQVLVRLGQHTDAIRLVRQHTGLGLIEGRDLVSSLNS